MSKLLRLPTFSLAVGIFLVACISTQTGLSPTSSPTHTRTPSIPIADLIPFFGYDSEAELDVEEVGIECRDDVAVHDLAYASPVGGRVTAPLDAVHYVGHATPAALFFQCARKDEIITAETLLRYYEAGSQPKRITWYDAGHSLNDQARLDRAVWLVEQIGLDASAGEHLGGNR